jgi:hypothetical protein
MKRKGAPALVSAHEAVPDGRVRVFRENDRADFLLSVVLWKFGSKISDTLSVEIESDSGILQAASMPAEPSYFFGSDDPPQLPAGVH